MYSDGDLNDAIAAGVLTREAADGFRRHVAGRHASVPADEEQFRLLTGFNDVFVAMALVMVLVGLFAVGAGLQLPTLGSDLGALLGAGLTAAGAWGLAEFFTRPRRLALSSIVLQTGWLVGMAFVAAFFANLVGEIFGADATATGFLAADWRMASALALAAGAAWLHWRRFHVPITVASGMAAATVAIILLLMAVAPELFRNHWLNVMFLCGLGLFAAGMRWDASDRARRTRRADVAFWLHLFAAPMIVHPVFGWLTGLEREIAAFGTIGLYLVLAFVSLVIDRRAVLVSALSYLIWAMSELVFVRGGVGGEHGVPEWAIIALVIGASLLLLSAAWQRARALIVPRLPVRIRILVPEAQGTRAAP